MLVILQFYEFCNLLYRKFGSLDFLSKTIILKYRKVRLMTLSCLKQGNASVMVTSPFIKMNYSTIKNYDIANGNGVRVSLFVSGCTNRCSGCFQKQTWDFMYGTPFTNETENHIISLLSPSYIKGLSLLGGEPMEPANQITILPFLKKIKKIYPNKDIWCFTGFTYELLKTNGSYPRCPSTDEILSLIDVLVDGPFIEEKKDMTLWFRGSSNQRVINLKETIKTGIITIIPSPLDRK